jgi:hypothetical protein
VSSLELMAQVETNPQGRLSVGEAIDLELIGRLAG